MTSLFFNNQRISSVLLACIISTFSFFLVACGSGSSSNSPDTPALTEGFISLPLSQNIRSILQTPIGELHVEVSIDDMLYDLENTTNENNVINGKLGINLLPGKHRITLNYYLSGLTLQNSPFRDLLVAETIEIEFDVIAGEENQALFSVDDLSYPDDDGDGFQNIVEITFGTNPSDPLSKPTTEISMGSATYSMFEAIGSVESIPTQGLFLAGKSTSVNYTLSE